MCKIYRAIFRMQLKITMIKGKLTKRSIISSWLIDKFPFASDGNATDVGDLVGPRNNMAGQSSADNGYASGGRDGSNTDMIQKFPFASDNNAADVGDLTQVRTMATGQQG